MSFGHDSGFDPPPPRHFPGPMSAFVITLGAWFLALTLMALFFGENLDIGALGVGQVLGFGGVAILATQRIPSPQSERLGLRGFSPSLLPLLLCLLPAVLLTSELDNILREVIPPPQLDPDAEKALTALSDNSTLYATIQRLIVIVGLAPVMEEWLFRGVIQQGLMGNLGRVRGVVLAAMLFSVGQLSSFLTPTNAISNFTVVFIHGLVFGYVRVATGSLFASMVLHMGFNAVSLAAFYAVDAYPIEGFNVPDSHTSLLLLIPAAVAVAIGFRGLDRQYTPGNDVIPLHAIDDPLDD